MSSKIRIFKLAKELNVASDTLISFLRDSGHEVRNVNSPVDEIIYEEVMEHFSVEKTIAERRETMRRKRAILRGDIEEGTGQIAVDTVEAEKQPRITKKPAILEALASLKLAALSSVETKEVATTEEKAEGLEEIKEIVEKQEREIAEKTATDEIIDEKEIETREVTTAETEKTVVPEAVDAIGKEAVPPATEDAVLVEEETVIEKVEAKIETAEDVSVTAAGGETKEQPVEADVAPEAEEEYVPKIGEQVDTIELPEEKPRKGKRAKKEEAKKPRRLSKKGIGLAEKIREKKQKDVLIETKEVEGVEYKKTKKRKRVRKKKIDAREIDASIKETMAKMEESAKLKKYRKKAKVEEEDVEEQNVINVMEYISVAELSGLMGVETNEVIKKCLELGLIVSINQRLDLDTITTVADEFGFDVNEIRELDEIEFEDEEEDVDNLETCPPVVTIMGHVDHGKTSLLDYIRQTNVVAGEKGGITQHIGAYEVANQEKSITFLDTPGHEAFTAMRARGTQVTDIVVLVIAADDNVMPQTLEALNHAQAAGVPIIVAFNKIDKPEANVEKIKKQLADHKVLVESWGGKYQSVELSAKTGKGIEELLETILFQAELLDLKANQNGRAKGIIIEAKLEKGRGIVCTVLVNNGTMQVGNYFVCGQHHGRVKAMFNERGKKVKSAPPSTPVRIVGFSGMPQAGDMLFGMDSDREAKAVSLKRQQLKREHDFRRAPVKSLYDISEQIKLGEIKELLVIIKGDTDGSVEALEDSLLKLSTDEVEVKMIHKSVGAINEADVLLASASNAIIIGFHVRPNLNARNLAANEEVDIHLYDVIYDVIEDIKAALEGLLEPEISEEIEATVEIRDTFRVPKYGVVAGCYIVSGKVIRNNKVRLVRDGMVVYDGVISSLRRFKEDVKEVSNGFECGIGLDNFNDIKVGDFLETYKLVEVKRVLQ